MPDSSHIVWLEDCSGDCADLVGGKATGLGSLLREGLPVPPGFAVTTTAYREHVQRNHILESIQTLLRDATNVESQQRISEEIHQLFESSTASPELQEEVLKAHERLSGGTTQPMAVRSSATAEDLADASFAGQQETYLWLLGGREVLAHVVRCWSSLFSPQAIAYRAHRRMLHDAAMAVVVQRMVPAEAAGVMLTIDPVSGDRSAITIEAAYGLGAAVVNGEVTPDRYCVDKVSLEIRSRSIGPKHVAYRFSPDTQGTRLEPLPKIQQTQPCVTDEEVRALAKLGKHMEQAAGRPQDLEWAIGPGREIYLLQARPETVWSQHDTAPGCNQIRAARADEADQLTQLALRSKASWGYDAEFMEACARVLKITPERIERELFFVLEINGRVVGLVGLTPLGNDEVDLADLFIEPSEKRNGFGRQLFVHAVKVARKHGWRRMSILSDPFAEAFYVSMGARRVGEAPSDAGIPGRMLPLMALDLG